MNKMPVVDSRLRPDMELYSKTKIATSMDVALLFAEEIYGRDDDFIGIINLNTKGQVICLDVVSPETLKDNYKEIMTNSVLSGAGSFVIISNAEEEKARELAVRFGDTGRILNHKLMDFLSVDEEKNIKSFLREGISLESGIIYNDTVEVERGVINESEYIHNNLMLIEERALTSEEEITKEKAVELLAEDLMYRDREAICVLSLDEEGMPINGSVVSVGTISESLLSSKDVFKTPILSGADSIILMHNHPSGTPGPSNQDLDATRLLIDAANAVGLKVEDHIIVGGLSGQIHRMRYDGILNDMENGQWGQMLVKPVEKSAEHEKRGKKIMKEPNEQNFTQTLLKHTENSGYTLEVHDDKLLIVDIEGPEPFWEEVTLEYARGNACSRLEEDIKKNGEYYRKNGELDALKDDLEFLRGYDMDAAEDTVFRELRQKTELDMQKIPSFTQEQLPEQTAMNNFTGKDIQAEMTMEI